MIRKLLVAFSWEPCILQEPFNGRAIKTSFRAISSPVVLMAHKAVILTRKTPNKYFFGKYKNKKCQQQTQHPKHWQLETGELSNTHIISCHVMWSMCLPVFIIWESSHFLMEARDGSLESASKTLSIRSHLFEECTDGLRGC